MDAKLVIKLEPPYDMNGNGIPVIGMIPMVIPTLMNIWNAHSATIPQASNVPNESRDKVAMRSARQINRAKRPSSVAEPRNPSCSPTAVKMKSVCCWGTKFYEV
jgi:hypothetical protein